MKLPSRYRIRIITPHIIIFNIKTRIIPMSSSIRGTKNLKTIYMRIRITRYLIKVRDRSFIDRLRLLIIIYHLLKDNNFNKKIIEAVLKKSFFSVKSDINGTLWRITIIISLKNKKNVVEIKYIILY